MNSSGHEILDVGGLSLTEREPWAELRSAERGQPKGSICTRLPRELGRVSESTSFLRHELEGKGHSLETRALIPVK